MYVRSTADEHAEPYYAWVDAQRRVEKLEPGTREWQAAMREAIDAWEAMVSSRRAEHAPG